MSLLPREYNYVCDSCDKFFTTEHPLHLLGAYKCEDCHDKEMRQLIDMDLVKDVTESTLLSKQVNKTIEFSLRGDDLQMIRKIMDKIHIENEDIHSWLCYLKSEIIDQIK